MTKVKITSITLIIAMILSLFAVLAESKVNAAASSSPMFDKNNPTVSIKATYKMYNPNYKGIKDNTYKVVIKSDGLSKSDKNYLVDYKEW